MRDRHKPTDREGEIERREQYIGPNRR